MSEFQELLAQLQADPAVVAWADALAHELDSASFPGDALAQLGGLLAVRDGLRGFKITCLVYEDRVQHHRRSMTSLTWLEREVADPMKGHKSRQLYGPLLNAWQALPALAAQHQSVAVTLVEQRLERLHTEGGEGDAARGSQR